MTTKSKPLTYALTYKRDSASRNLHDGESRTAARHAANYERGEKRVRWGLKRWNYVALCGDQVLNDGYINIENASGTHKEVTCDRCRALLSLPTFRDYLRASKGNNLKWDEFIAQWEAQQKEVQDGTDLQTRK